MQTPQFSQVANPMLSYAISPGRTKKQRADPLGIDTLPVFRDRRDVLVKATPQFVTEEHILVGFIVLVISDRKCQLDLV